jgi:hypothetical protein
MIMTAVADQEIRPWPAGTLALKSLPLVTRTGRLR